MPRVSNSFNVYKKPYRKKKISTALRNQTWIAHMGERFRVKCPTTWCKNTITPFTFEAGHNIPESKGGQTVIENLVPICSNCNKSMGNTHTFDTWCSTYSALSQPFQTEEIPVSNKSNRFWRLFQCF